MRPPRLMWREMARRAASIWRAVRRPRSVAFRPNSPNDTSAPRVAMPVLRPFCSLRNLRRAGCSMLILLCLRRRRAGGAAALRTRLTAGALGASPPALPARLAAPRGRLRPARRATVAIAAGRTAAAATRRVASAARPAARTAIVFGARRRDDHRRFAVGQAVTAVDPDLDADDAVGRLGFGEAVVDVGLQGVQRHATFAVPLAARDFDAVQAARAT